MEPYVFRSPKTLPQRSDKIVWREKIKVRGEALNKEWWIGKQWSVTEYGIECRDGTYAIAKNRLVENPKHPWPAHMVEKDWVDIEDFVAAWLIAIALHGVKGNIDRTLLCDAIDDVVEFKTMDDF